MPITKSAKKALRQSVRRRAQNIKRKDAYKEAVKIVRTLVEAGSGSEAAAKLSALYKALDKAAKTHVIKPNKASRLKSRLTKLIQPKK
ncbi:MAG: 30S ribosomal protein S20 [Candidatus Sungbacteria bacterium]|nr:30S ribosomal protein S20 [Candidatus Sungbacteria bacterium]